MENEIILRPLCGRQGPREMRFGLLPQKHQQNVNKNINNVLTM